MKESYGSKPEEIELFLVDGNQTDVIIRRNLEQVEEALEEGGAQITWRCDETQFRYGGILAEEDIRSAVDKWLLYATKASLDALNQAKTALIGAMSDACNATITAGFTAILSDGESHHFSLETTDQIMISLLASKAAAGETVVPWHADGEDCRFFSQEDIALVNSMMESLVIYNTTYFNSIRRWILSIESVDDLSAVRYGVEIPAEYQSEVLQSILAGNAQAE